MTDWQKDLKHWQNEDMELIKESEKDEKFIHKYPIIKRLNIARNLF